MTLFVAVPLVELMPGGTTVKVPNCPSCADRNAKSAIKSALVIAGDFNLRLKNCVPVFILCVLPLTAVVILVGVLD